MIHRLGRLGATLVWLGLMTAPVYAYPGAVVFVPNGEAKQLGQVSALFYTGYFGSNPYAWNGLNLGIAPKLPYGDSGLSFGGAEIGMDVYSQFGLDPAIKPLFNAKAQLLVEKDWWPHLAVGTMQISLPRFDRGMNMVYASASKTLSWCDMPLGRVTVGGGANFALSAAQFTATWPFERGQQGFAMAGYETPRVGPAYLAIDHLGGISEIGGTFMALHVETAPGQWLGLGAAFSNDRATAVPDAVHVYFAPSWDLFDGNRQ